VLRALLWFAAWMLFGFALVESLHTAVDWWQGRLAEPELREWFWLLLLPLLIAVYLRFFSIFNPGCRACQPPPDEPPRREP
jgi:hypothetical protein